MTETDRGRDHIDEGHSSLFNFDGSVDGRGGGDEGHSGLFNLNGSLEGVCNGFVTIWVKDDTNSVWRGALNIGDDPRLSIERYGGKRFLFLSLSLSLAV